MSHHRADWAAFERSLPARSGWNYTYCRECQKIHESAPARVTKLVEYAYTWGHDPDGKSCLVSWTMRLCPECLKK